MNIASYPKYISYKDSGEGWLEEVPSHWELRKLKQLFQEKKHKANMALNCGAISFGEVVEKDDDRIPQATKASYQEVLAGEFLVNPLNLNYDLKSLRIGLSEIDVVVSAGYIVLQSKADIDRQYFKYLLHRYDVANMKLLGSGVRQTISFNHIANSQLVAPPLPEQRAIAAFLERKCAKIDDAVRIKEEQIALLRERRQILIQQAVTRGLNPDVPMKDSGSDEIGPIPAHWKVKRLRHATQISPSKRIDGNLNRNDKVVFLPMEAIGADGVIRQDLVGPAKEVSEGFTYFRKGDVIVAKITPCFENGKGAFLSNLATEYGFGTTELHVLRPKNVSGDFLYHFINRSFFRSHGEAFMVGSAGQKRVSTEYLKDQPIPIPPETEQVEIVRFLNGEGRKVDAAVSIKESQIAALKEYKMGLINAAVTGKIKVTSSSLPEFGPDKMAGSELKSNEYA